MWQLWGLFTPEQGCGQVWQLWGLLTPDRIGSNDMNADALLFPFLFGLEPQAMQWCHPYSGWAFLPQLYLSGNTLNLSLRGMFLRGFLLQSGC